jgi:hypothetical protein
VVSKQLADENVESLLHGRILLRRRRKSEYILRNAAAAAAAAAAGILIHRQIIWVKPCLLLGRGDYHWRHELGFYCVGEEKANASSAKIIEDRS